MIPIRLLLAILFLVIALYYYAPPRGDVVRAIFWLVLGAEVARIVGLVAVY